MAPYDEFVKGAVRAVFNVGKEATIDVYGADISTLDIAIVRQPSSPWVATVATSAKGLGRASVWAAAVWRWPLLSKWPSCSSSSRLCVPWD